MEKLLKTEIKPKKNAKANRLKFHTISLNYI